MIVFRYSAFQFGINSEFLIRNYISKTRKISLINSFAKEINTFYFKMKKYNFKKLFLKFFYGAALTKLKRQGPVHKLCTKNAIDVLFI